MNTKQQKQGETTHFGYQNVTWEEKTRLVNEVFNHVAERYDLMNDLMSLGIHRIWKKFAIEISRVRHGEHVLDCAGGSGDLTMKLAKRVGPTGSVTLTDLNFSMINAGRDRLINHSTLNHVHYVQSNAEELPFCDNTFDCITIAFGLRNVSKKENALRSMFRILKPGGRLLILEFSQPAIEALKPLYDAYSFYVLPALGQLVTGHPESYRYLAESIRMHPNQKQLKKMVEEAGFEDCIYYNLTAGIVAIHKAYKY